jgi:hypothetical protein
MLFCGSLRDLGWHAGKPRYLLMGYFVPLLYASAIYVTVWVTGLGGFVARPIVIGGHSLPLVVSLADSAEGRRASPGERRRRRRTTGAKRVGASERASHRS